MTAGVPGLGLGGLFALLAALCLPLLRSSSRRHRLRLFGMALLIVVAAVLAWQSLSWLYSVVSSGDTGAATGHLVKSGHAITQPVVGRAFGVPVIVISFVVLALLLLAGEALFRTLGERRTPMPPPIPAPLKLAFRVVPASAQSD